MQITPEMIEAAARARCKREGYIPDSLVHYEDLGTIKAKRDPLPDYLLKPGVTRSNGKPYKQYPSMPFWRWKYAHGAEEDLKAALGDGQLKENDG